MPLPRTEVIPGLAQELVDFEALIRSLSPTEWATPTRCEGWTVADVCAHTVGTISDIAGGRLNELVPTPDQPSPSARQVAERRGRGSEEIADELRDSAKPVTDLGAAFDDAAWAGPPPIDVGPTLGFAVEAIWFDTYVHAEDVRAAIGRPSELGPGLRASVSHVAGLLADKGWGPASLQLDGMSFDVGAGGSVVTGDPLAFVLAATGRGDPGPWPVVNVFA